MSISDFYYDEINSEENFREQDRQEPCIPSAEQAEEYLRNKFNLKKIIKEKNNG
jgi:hypothetical protein